MSNDANPIQGADGNQASVSTQERPLTVQDRLAKVLQAQVEDTKEQKTEEGQALPQEPTEEPQEILEEEIQPEQGESESSKEESVIEDSEEEDSKAKEEEAKKLYAIKIDGVEEKVTFKELKELAQKGKDYTNKTKQLSSERERLESEYAQKLQQTAGQYLEKLEIVGKVIHSNAISEAELNRILEEEGSEAFLKAKQAEESRQKQLAAIASEWQQTRDMLSQQQMLNTRKKAEQHTQQLAKIMPHLLTGDGAKPLVSYLRDSGFTPEEIAETYDYRALSIAEKARKWDELQAKRPLVNKKVEKAPKMMKPGKTKEPAEVNKQSIQKAKSIQKQNRGDRESTVNALRAIFNQ